MSPGRDAEPTGPVLLYDGACGLCGATVAFVLRRDPGGALRFAPLGGPFAAAVAGRHPELAGADSVVWVDAPGTARERVHLRSGAALRVAAYLGGAWRVLGALRLVPRALRDAGYDLVARHRHRLAGARACVVPGPAERARFLEEG